MKNHPAILPIPVLLFLLLSVRSAVLPHNQNSPPPASQEPLRSLTFTSSPGPIIFGAPLTRKLGPAVLTRSVWHKPFPPRILSEKPEIRVLTVEPISTAAAPVLEEELSPLVSINPLWSFLANGGRDIDDSRAFPKSARSSSQQSSAVSVSYSSDGGKPKVHGFVQEVTETPLSNGETLVKEFKQPIKSQDDVRNLNFDFPFKFFDFLEPSKSPLKSKLVSRRGHRRNSHKVRKLGKKRSWADSKETRQLPLSDPLELLLGGEEPRQAKAFQFASHRGQAAHKRHHRVRRVVGKERSPTASDLLGFLPDAPDSTLAPPRRQVLLRYVEPDRFAPAKASKPEPSDFLLDLLRNSQSPESSDRLPLFEEQHADAPDKEVSDLLEKAFGPQMPETSLFGKDINEDQTPSNSLADQDLADLFNAVLSGNDKPTPQEDQSSDLAELLKQISPDDKPKANQNRIVLPVEDYESSNKESSQDLARLLGMLAAASGPESQESEPLQQELEDPPALKRLRGRLPMVDFDAKVPLMNNFYSIGRIKNRGRPLVFPPLGHRARPSPLFSEQPPVRVVYRRREQNQTHGLHHKGHYQKYARYAEPERGLDKTDAIAELIGSLLAPNEEADKLAKI